MAGKAAGKRGSTPALEWISAGLGLVIALFVLGMIGWQAMIERDEPVPLLGVRIVAVTGAGKGQVATVAVTNTSGRTAASVQVEGVIGKDTPDEQTSTAMIDYVAGHSQASAGLIFAAPPGSGPISVRVTGYEHP